MELFNYRVNYNDSNASNYRFYIDVFINIYVTKFLIFYNSFILTFKFLRRGEILNLKSLVIL